MLKNLIGHSKINFKGGGKKEEEEEESNLN